MTTLAEHMIVAGADNRPPMLENTMYNSWQNHMLLYINGKEHGRMMLNSIKHGPLVYGTIEVDGVTKTKTYEELTDAKKLQDDCDVKATNIILQGLPPEVCSLFNHHHVANEIWDRVKLLMQGTERSQQEHECKLYDDFDRFTLVKGESLHEYYLRFAQLMNDMHTIGMTTQQVQVNTKFLNTLSPEWSKFVTDVKLARNMHTTNYDQIFAYLIQHEAHATKVRLMHERFPDPLALISNNSHIPSYQTNHQSQYNPTHYQQHSSPLAQQYYHSQQHSQSYEAPSHYKQYQPPAITQQPSVPQNVYQSSAMSQQPQAEFPQLDSGLAVPSFLLSDDPIASLNKAMAFLTTAITSRFPTTNNQLITSSNLRNQATIQDGRVTVQQMHGRQHYSFAGMGSKSNATGSVINRNRGTNATVQARVVRFYNCQGERHMARQCTQPKRPMNSAWFKEKILLVQAHKAGQVLDEEQLAFLVDPGVSKKIQDTQTKITHNVAF
ncbi:hypothetical protein Tco_1103874 [Tanacetum coccineum]